MTVTIDGSASVTINSGAILGLTSATAQASTSGTSINFTDIPSWVKRITVMLGGVSLTTTASNIGVRIGSGSFEATGYVGGYGVTTTVPAANAAASDQYIILGSISAAADTLNGALIITNVSGNLWVAQGTFFRDSGTTDAAFMVAASKTTSGVLDRAQVTLTSTGAFDAGTINIMYE
jgi:hypothetical protein